MPNSNATNAADPRTRTIVDRNFVLRQMSFESRHQRPTLAPAALTWPRQIPIEGEPADVTQIVTDYGEWLSSSDVPKLPVNADPGAILNGPQLEYCRTWPNQTEVTVAGNHFCQEDSPDEIGQAIADWLGNR
ncbi:hypothetical protein [Candidatus Poriferisodalis sp.]|uniref:hypothetical protein n=1 Tax=Candidatus Poriferisodalis sp. TaxID=3101277 RepID=UPI003AF6C11A